MKCFYSLMLRRAAARNKIRGFDKAIVHLRGHKNPVQRAVRAGGHLTVKPRILIREQARRGVICASFSVCLVLTFGLNAAHAQNALTLRLNQILAAPALKGGITGAIVCRASDGKVLYEHNADLRLLPASNRKLFTSAAALELLGDDFQIETDLKADAVADPSGTIPGRLYLQGGGDGLLSMTDIDDMTRTLARSGVKRVAGDIVGDGSRFTDGPYGFGWEWDDFSDEEFPQISALWKSMKAFSGVHVAPGAKSAGDSGDSDAFCLPTAYLSNCQSSAVTGDERRAKATCEVSRPWNNEQLRPDGYAAAGEDDRSQKYPFKIRR